MRLKGPEEVGVVAVSRTLGPGLVGVSAAGASPSDAASPSKGGGEGQKAVAKVGTLVHKGLGSPQGPPLIWVLPAF
jgi:hypothetical protein